MLFLMPLSTLSQSPHLRRMAGKDSGGSSSIEPESTLEEIIRYKHRHFQLLTENGYVLDSSSPEGPPLYSLDNENQ